MPEEISGCDIAPNLGQIWGIIIPKFSKQDKIEIFNLWQNYQVGTTELSRPYQVNPSTINYLLAFLNRHGIAIHTMTIKEQAIRRVLVKDKAIYQVALDLGLKNKGILANWLHQ